MVRDFEYSYNNATLIGAGTLFAMSPATSLQIGVEILRVRVTQTGTNLSAQQRIQLVTKFSPFQAGSSVTGIIASLNRGDTNPSTWIVNSGGIASEHNLQGAVSAGNENGGGLNLIMEDTFNILDGWIWEPEKDETIIVPSNINQAFTVYLPTSPVSLTGWNLSLVFREIS